MPRQKRSYWHEADARRALAEIERRGEAERGVPAADGSAGEPAGLVEEAIGRFERRRAPVAVLAGSGARPGGAVTEAAR